VFSEPQFHVVMFAASMTCAFCCSIMDGGFCICVGCVKFGICCKHFRDSFIRASGRYGNVDCRVS
jgi:hypothetical protein